MVKSLKQYYDDIARTAKRALTKESAQSYVRAISKAVVDTPREISKLFSPSGFDASVELIAFGNTDPLKDMYSQSSAMDAALTAARFVQGGTLSTLKVVTDVATTGNLDIDRLGKSALDVKYLVEHEGWTREQLEAREAYKLDSAESVRDAKNFLIRSGVDASLVAAETALLASSVVTATPAVGVVGTAAIGGLMKANRGRSYV